MRSQTDPQSNLERYFLDYLFEERLTLPDEAQKLMDEHYCSADFYYRDGYVCVFCDGSVHDNPGRAEEDDRVRRQLMDSGFRVVVIKYDRPIRDQANEHQDVFGATQQ